jgi:hypothetical protein
MPHYRLLINNISNLIFSSLSAHAPQCLFDQKEETVARACSWDLTIFWHERLKSKLLTVEESKKVWNFFNVSFWILRC